MHLYSRLNHRAYCSVKLGNILLFLVVLAVYVYSSRSFAQSENDQIVKKEQANQIYTTSRYIDGEEVLFTLVVDKFALGEVNTIVNNGQYYIHLEDFIESANFVIERVSTIEEKRYEGWWSKETNSFKLHFSSDPGLLNRFGSGIIAVVDIKGEQQGLSQSDIVDYSSETYIRADIIADWFENTFSFDETKLRLNATTSQPWPFQLSQLRQNAKTNTLRKTPEAEEPHYDPGYSMLSPQTINFISTVRANRIQSENSSTIASYSLLGRQDILGLSTRFYAAGNDNDILNQGTVDFSRTWNEVNQGPLGITRLKFGDVQAVRVGNNSTTATRGVFISNTDLDRRSNQERTNISGLVQAGWDIELYQNQVLVQQLFDVQSGRYEFLDLPLFSGLNEFEVIKYGPQGQVEKETFERLVDSSLSNNLDASYEVSLTQNNRDTLGIQSRNPELPDNFAFSGNYFLGIGERSSINFAHVNQLGDSVLNDQYRVGFVSKFGDKTILNSNYTYTPNQSHDAAIAIRTGFWSQLLSARFNVQKDETGTALDEFAGGAQLLFSGNVFQTASQSLYQQTDFRTQKNFTGDTTLSASNRLAYRTKWFGLNHSIDYTKREDNLGNVEDFAFGVVNTSFNIGDVRTRAGGSYRIEDDTSWESVFVNANWYLLNALSIRAEYTRNLQLKTNSYGLGFDWKHDLYGITARIDHSDLYDTSFSLSARISFSEAPTEFGYIQSKRNLAEYGTVLVRVYHDVNNNRIFDADDIPIKDAKVSAVQSRRFTETDVIGIAQLDGLSSFRKTDIELDMSSLDNPFLVQSTFKTSITPRAGLVTLVNYPLVEGGEIEGEISFVDEYDRVQYLANVPLVIKDSSGKHVANIKAGLDGYYYYSGLIPHTYYLSVEEGYLARKNFKPMQAKKINVKEQGQQLLGVDLQLEERPRVDGFIVVSGEFDSKNYLQRYYELINSKLASTVLKNTITPFEHQVENNKYTLGLLFTKNKADADKLCEQLSEYISSCVVKNHLLVL